MHNKDKHRLFQKYIKQGNGTKSAARDLVGLLNKKNLTPKRVKKALKPIMWGWLGSQIGDMIMDTANRPGLMRRVLEKVESDKWANALATRCGHRWHKIEKYYGE